jgi:hypothetical protein
MEDRSGASDGGGGTASQHPDEACDRHRARLRLLRLVGLRARLPGGLWRAPGRVADYQPAWNFIYGTWLPESGFQPDDRLCYESYPMDVQATVPDKHVVDICVPVKPL